MSGMWGKNWRSITLSFFFNTHARRYLLTFVRSLLAHFDHRHFGLNTDTTSFILITLRHSFLPILTVLPSFQYLSWRSHPSWTRWSSSITIFLWIYLLEKYKTKAAQCGKCLRNRVSEILHFFFCNSSKGQDIAGQPAQGRDVHLTNAACRGVGQNSKLSAAPFMFWHNRIDVHNSYRTDVSVWYCALSSGRDLVIFWSITMLLLHIISLPKEMILHMIGVPMATLVMWTLFCVTAAMVTDDPE